MKASLTTTTPSAIHTNALDVVLIRAVGLQRILGLGEVLVSNEHGQRDAKSESRHDEQHLKQVGGGRVRMCCVAREMDEWKGRLSVR
jgi:hypothetical protein